MKRRILLVSDMHYTTNMSNEQMKKTNPEVEVSAAAGDAFGYTQEQKIERIISDILFENQKEKLDMVLILGDLSIDDYSYRKLPDNYCKKFKEECMDKLPCPCYALPGNHDSYPNHMWKEAVGTDRQFCVSLDNYVFVMMDNFNSIPANGAAGSRKTPADVDWLKFVLKEHSGKKFFLCAHMFDSKNESEEFKELVRENDDIIALFRGHTHYDKTINLASEWGYKKLIDIGGYAYNGFIKNNKYTFSIFDETWAWGYQMLEIGDEITTWHRKPSIYYKAENGEFDFQETVTEKVLL